MNVRANQGGSVASFIIIGVVLVIMTTGILYWVSHKDVPVAREAPPVTLPGNDVSPRGEANQTKPTQEETAPAETAPEARPTDEDETITGPQTEVTALSQTGPADTALQVIAIGALAIAGVSFIRSRRLASSL